jgi:hypothetical protein
MLMLLMFLFAAFSITPIHAIVSIVAAFVVSAIARWTAESTARYIIGLGYLRTVRYILRVPYRLCT